MSRAKIVIKVDPKRTGTDASVEKLLRQVVTALVPHLQHQVGPVDYRQGEQPCTKWTTEGWLADGTYVSLGIGVGADELELFIDTSPVLTPSRQMSVSEKIGLLIVAAVAAFATWWHFRSFVSMLGGIFIGVALWTTFEILFTIRKERIASACVIDEENWRRRLLEATFNKDIAP